MKAYLVKWKVEKMVVEKGEGIDSVYAVNGREAEDIVFGKIYAGKHLRKFIKGVEVKVIKEKEIKEA